MTAGGDSRNDPMTLQPFGLRGFELPRLHYAGVMASGFLPLR
jgi:hypothetical protein